MINISTPETMYQAFINMKIDATVTPRGRTSTHARKPKQPHAYAEATERGRWSNHMQTPKQTASGRQSNHAWTSRQTARYVSHIPLTEWRHWPKPESFCTLNLTLTLTLTITLTMTLTYPNVTLTLT